jgi:deazaflavin-dependent oxidoreductase (nitroreductase family)
VPAPRWLARINKRIFNRLELKRGVRPVLTHHGRTSGDAYRTPLDTYPVEDGYLFVMVYGRDSDWVKNVMAAGGASLAIEGREVGLVEPRVVSEDAVRRQLREAGQPMPRNPRDAEYLRMDIAE